MRHLIDDWTDHRFGERTNALKNPTDPNIYTILSGWYAIESSSITNTDQNEDRIDKGTSLVFTSSSFNEIILIIC